MLTTLKDEVCDSNPIRVCTLKNKTALFKHSLDSDNGKLKRLRLSLKQFQSINILSQGHGRVQFDWLLSSNINNLSPESQTRPKHGVSTFRLCGGQI